MSDVLPRRHFLWSGLDLPFIVEAKIDDARITLRTWRLSANARLSNIMPVAEALERIGGHAAPFQIRPDPLGETRSGRDLWVALEALDGQLVPGDRASNLFAKPVCEAGFVIDPAITGSGAWADYSLWSFNARHDGMLTQPFNRHIETMPSKEHRYMLMGAREEANLLTLCVPFAGDTFDHCSFILKYNQTLGCIHNMPDIHAMPPTRLGWGAYDMEAVFGVKALMPSLRLTGPDSITAGQSAAFGIELFDRNSEALITDRSARLYIEASAGYLAQRQAQTTAGVAQVSLQALGLTPGETIKLKAGWRNYTGAAEKIVTVV